MHDTLDEIWEQPSCWDDALRRRFPGVDVVQPPPQDPAALIAGRALGDRWIWSVRGAPQRLAHHAHPSYDPVALLIQRTGESIVSQRGGRAELGAGSCLFLDTMAPTNMEISGAFEQRFIELPARFASTAAILSAPLTALSADSPADSPLLALLDALWGSAPHLSAAQQQHALAALDALLGVTSIAQRGAEQVRRHARFERAAAFIAAALADPDLTPSQVASAQHISRRSLDAIFAQHGWTITRWIWEQRLSAASAALRAPAHAHRSLLDIAIAHGFTSASHFSRAFRARFGLTPSAWRAAPHAS